MTNIHETLAAMKRVETSEANAVHQGAAESELLCLRRFIDERSTGRGLILRLAANFKKPMSQLSERAIELWITVVEDS